MSFKAHIKMTTVLLVEFLQIITTAFFNLNIDISNLDFSSNNLC